MAREMPEQTGHRDRRVLCHDICSTIYSTTTIRSVQPEWITMAREMPEYWTDCRDRRELPTYCVLATPAVCDIYSRQTRTRMAREMPEWWDCDYLRLRIPAEYLGPVFYVDFRASPIPGRQQPTNDGLAASCYVPTADVRLLLLSYLATVSMSAMGTGRLLCDAM